MATTKEIEDLKSSWESDPCWDIEDTEGFEDHYDELLAFHHRKILEWQQRAEQKVRDKAVALGCPGNPRLAEYVMSLEDQIDRIEKRLEKLENA